jgi:hypothetical protein
MLATQQAKRHAFYRSVFHENVVLVQGNNIVRREPGLRANL